MKIKEIEFLMKHGMLSVEDDNIKYVIEALKDMALRWKNKKTIRKTRF